MPTQIPNLEELFTLLRFPTISTQREHADDLKACAQWLAEKLQRIGLEAQVHPTAGHPIVLAKSKHDPKKPTVIIYGHYDVQPPEPLSEWISPPFEPTIRDGRIFARGSSDNKGQFYAHILGVEETLKRNGSLPVNVIFLIEGEEEIGSPHLASFLENHRKELAADVIVISDTGMIDHGYPTLSYGLRGVAAMECIIHGPSHDLHSGIYGGAIANPATAAARLIASLHHPDGKVAIEGFYDSVTPLAEWERKEFRNLPVSDKNILEQTGSPTPFGEPGYSSYERIGARPTAEVNGIGGGYQGEGTKTVIPKQAFFKLTFRLVPGQTAKQVLERAESHLQKHCPPGVTLEIKRGHSGEAYILDPNTGYGLAAQRALKRAFGRQPALTREGGSIPILLDFQRILGLDSLLAALAPPDAKAHSPNESFCLENLSAGIQLNQYLLEEIVAVGFRGDISHKIAEKNSTVC